MRRVLTAYLGLGLLLWPIPLLNVLQVEAAAVVAFVAFFVAGLSALSTFASGAAPVGRVLLRQEAALLVPLLMLTVAQLWAPNCTYGQGLLFYALFPGITVAFAVAVAYAVDGARLSRPRLTLIGIGVLLVLGGPLYDLVLHPQFYTYNHVFGGILGPIYDEQLSVRPGLFVFRGLTLLWTGAALLLGLRLRGRGPRWALPLCLLAIGLVYAFRAPLGINTTAGHLQEQLGGHVRTAHFDVYYDPDAIDRAALQTLIQKHEAQYQWVRARLGEPSDTSTRIQSYIYPNPDVKGHLTGARETSISPVWLATPQVHLLQDRVETSLGHELAHVVSRPYGLPGLRASWAPGLVEGWAVALEPPSLAPPPDDLVLTAAAADTGQAGDALTAAADGIATRLSPWGFWTGRGAVSYATMGSFVRFLLDRYGPGPLKRVYAWGRFEHIYGQPLRALAAEWAAHVRGQSVVSRGAHDVVARRFTQPSLFEAECPHYVPPHRRHLQAAERAARQRDTLQMEQHLHRALAVEPQFAAAHQALARLRLAQRQAAAVRTQLDTLSASVRAAGVRIAQADAHAVGGAADTARRLYNEALDRTPHYAHDTRARLMLRDAVADQPAVVQVLVSGDSALAQARRLEGSPDRGGAVQAWRGVRLMDAHAHGEALAIWRNELDPVRSERPRSWQRTWTLQHTAWGAEAALRAGSTAVAEQWARRGARHAQRLGDSQRATVLNWWAQRAGRIPSPPERAPSGHPAP